MYCRLITSSLVYNWVKISPDMRKNVLINVREKPEYTNVCIHAYVHSSMGVYL